MRDLLIAGSACLPACMQVLLTATTPLRVVFFDMVFSRRNVPSFWLPALLAVFGAVLLKAQGGAAIADGGSLHGHQGGLLRTRGMRWQT